MWLKWCALHNMLLCIDGIDKKIEDGIPSQWEIVNDNCKRPTSKLDVPFAILKLNRYFSNEVIAALADVIHDYDSDQFKIYTRNGKIVVSKMPLSLFQQCLVNRFDIRYKQNDIIWPRRLKKQHIME